MKPYYVLPTLGGSFQQAHAVRPERPDRQIDETPRFGATRLISDLESALRRSIGGISRWRRRRTAIRELQGLSDHYLTDIGLDRSQIVPTVEEIIATGGQPLWHHAAPGTATASAGTLMKITRTP